MFHSPNPRLQNLNNQQSQYKNPYTSQRPFNVKLGRKVQSSNQTATTSNYVSPNSLQRISDKNLTYLQQNAGLRGSSNIHVKSNTLNSLRSTDYKNYAPLNQVVQRDSYQYKTDDLIKAPNFHVKRVVMNSKKETEEDVEMREENEKTPGFDSMLMKTGGIFFNLIFF